MMNWYFVIMWFCHHGYEGTSHYILACVINSLGVYTCYKFYKPHVLLLVHAWFKNLKTMWLRMYVAIQLAMYMTKTLQFK